MSDASLSWNDYEKKIAAASDESTIDAIEQDIFGRKQGAMTVAMKSLKDVAEDKRKDKAKELNDAKRSIQTALDAKRASLKIDKHANLAESDSLDVTLNLPRKGHGHLHLIPEFIAQVEEVFGRMGFDVAYGPEIETEELNFNLLNIPEDHPARDAQDTFAIASEKKGKDRLVLRTHTSPVQIRYMQEHKPPFRMICPGKVYRKDSDATHSPMFHQFEGFMVAKGLTVANLRGVIEFFVHQYFGKERKIRLRPHHFRFTEPSFEVDISCDTCGADESISCRVCKGGWLELGGAGMTHPNVLKAGGIDPNEYQAFAFGFGIERTMMMREGTSIDDIRVLYRNDMNFVKQF